jgi:hypothetical protein
VERSTAVDAVISSASVPTWNPGKGAPCISYVVAAREERLSWLPLPSAGSRGHADPNIPVGRSRGIFRTRGRGRREQYPLSVLLHQNLIDAANRAGTCVEVGKQTKLIAAVLQRNARCDQLPVDVVIERALLPIEVLNLGMVPR